jgi:hypothetical protein
VTPSDFALVVRNIPLDITKERLIQLVEDRFSRSKVKVAYVNMCYNIEDIFKANSKITELSDMIRRVHDMVHNMSEKRTDQIINWGVGIIGTLLAATVYLITTYVLK